MLFPHLVAIFKRSILKWFYRLVRLERLFDKRSFYQTVQVYQTAHNTSIR